MCEGNIHYSVKYRSDYSWDCEYCDAYWEPGTLPMIEVKLEDSSNG